VPSAEQVVSEGVDMAKMDAKLLEKIEELTLYTIQLEKTTQNQQRTLLEQQRINQHQAARLQALEQEHLEIKKQLRQLLNRK